MANTTTITQSKHGQYFLTFPKAIAEAMGVTKGDQIRFIIVKGYIVLEKIGGD